MVYRDGDFLEVVGRRPRSERECTSATQSSANFPHAVGRDVVASLLEQRSNVGGDADPSLISDVLSEFRHAGLG